MKVDVSEQTRAAPSSGPKEADAGRNPSGIPVGHIVGDPDQNENKI